MWAKGQNDQAPVAETNQNESYSVVRDRALRHRESSAPGEIDGDMKLLYQFWSHFLVRNFNPRMYEDFRTCAAEDVQLRQDMFGMNNLINYYDEILNSKKKPISEILAKHYVDLVNSEDRTQARPGFKKLRAAWRNGALDLRSRKTIDGFVDMQLRQELDL
jgi:la-related protein 1